MILLVGVNVVFPSVPCCFWLGDRKGIWPLKSSLYPRPFAAFLHYCTDSDVTLGNGRGCPPSCALLGGFAVSEQVLLLWQHTRVMLHVSEDACTCCMVGLEQLVEENQEAVNYCGCYFAE